MKLEKEIQLNVDSLIAKATEYYQSGNFISALNCLNQAWDLLPELKNEFDDSYRIAKYIVLLSLKFKEFETASKWISILYECNKNRIDSGEREYLHGKVVLAMNNESEAKLLFRIAYQKSEGRYPEEKEFLNLIK